MISAVQAATAATLELSLVRGFAKPEDVELVPGARILLASEMGFDAPTSGGGLSAVTWSADRGLTGSPHRLGPSSDALPPHRELGDPACTGPPDPSFFSGHGLSVATTGRAAPLVAVVGHGAREAIEYFALHGIGEEVRAGWVGCVLLPPEAAGNDLVLESSGAVLVTNYIPSVHGITAWVWLQLAQWGWTTGNVLSWSPAAGWSEVPGSEGSMPNGIARQEGRTIVAYNGAHYVTALPEDAQPAQEPLALPGAPDNLSAAWAGGLLAALLHESPPGAWSIASIDPTVSRFAIVFDHDGSRLAGVTSVAHDGTRYFLGSMIGDAIGVLTPRDDPAHATSSGPLDAHAAPQEGVR
jgi:hypothetical protein